MRITRLDLIAYGPFAGAALPFCAGGGAGPAGPQLAVVYGPNEAGKSSALRAVRAGLFGFPHVTDDAHRHGYDALRVGLSLAGPGGDELHVVRRKGTKNTLADPDGAALPDAALEPFLGATTPETFDRLHGIDLGELTEGGGGLLGGGGEVGQLLFAAAGGLAHLRRVREALAEEAGALFKSRGKNPAINASLAELKSLRADRGVAELAPGRWEAQCEEVRRLSDRGDDLRERFAAVGTERHRLARLTAARATADRLDENAARTAELAPAVAADAPLRAAAGRVRDLERRAAQAAGAAADRPKLERDAAAAERAAAAALADLRPAGAGETWTPPEPSGPERARVRAAADEHAKLAAAVGAADAAGRAAAAAVGKNAAALAACSPLGPDDADALRAALDRAAPLGDPAADRAELDREIDGLGGKIARGLARLRGFEGDADALAALPLPAAATVARFEADRRDAAGDLAAAGADAARAAARREGCEAELAGLSAGGAVPSEADLAAARAARDAAWKILKPTLSGDADPPGAAAAGGYESLAAAADAAADGLRREAGRVEKAAAATAGRDRAAAEFAAAGRARDAAAAALAELDGRWARQWPAAVSDPLPPAEMRPWLDAAAALLADHDVRRDLTAERAALDARVAECSAALAGGLAALNDAAGSGAEVDSDGLSLPALRSRAARAVERLSKFEGRRETLQAARAEAEAAVRAAAADRAAAAAELDRWAADWAAAVAPLGLSSGAGGDGETHGAATPRPPAAEAFVVAWEEAAQHRRAAAERRERLAEIDAFAARLAEDAAAAAAGLAPDLTPGGDGPADAAALAEALAARLRAAEDRAAEHGKLPAERAKLLRELDEQRGPEGAEAFLAAARAADPDAAAARAAELEADADRLAADRDAAVRAVRDAEATLAAMDTRGRAAREEQRAQDLLSEVDGDADRYARVRIADALLAEAADRYRRKHQGPVLGRAGGYFRRLTLGSFAGLDVAFDDADEPTLVGLRPPAVDEKGVAADPVRLPPAAMSDGTRDQLYLALRLAGLAETASKRPPYATAPLIVDDVFDRFDDDRSAAALAVLAELSESVQVIVFTHHRHLAELAAATLGDAATLVPLPADHLPAPPPAPPRPAAPRPTRRPAPAKARSAAEDRQKALL